MDEETCTTLAKKIKTKYYFSLVLCIHHQDTFLYSQGFLYNTSILNLCVFSESFGRQSRRPWSLFNSSFVVLIPGSSSFPPSSLTQVTHRVCPGLAVTPGGSVDPPTNRRDLPMLLRWEKRRSWSRRSLSGPTGNLFLLSEVQNPQASKCPLKALPTVEVVEARENGLRSVLEFIRILHSCKWRPP